MHQPIAAAPLDLLPLLLPEASNHTIYFVIELSTAIDLERLSSAIDTLCRIHPLLSYKLMDNNGWPHWEQDPSLQKAATMSVLSHTDPELLTQLNQTIKRWGFHCHVLRKSAGDTLCIALSHTLGDGATLKELGYRLAALYLQPQINQQITIGRERPCIHNTSQSNRFWQRSRSLLRPPYRAPSWHLPKSHTSFEEKPESNLDIKSETIHEKTTCYQILKTAISKKSLSTNHNNDKRFNTIATINDRLLAGLAAALPKYCPITSSNKLSLQFTADLRRYLHNRQTMPPGNLSGTEYVTVHIRNLNNYQNILANIQRQTATIKRNMPGFGSALVLESILKHSFVRQRQRLKTMLQKTTAKQLFNPLLTNFGSISPQLLKFGTPETLHAYIVSPNLLVPGLMVGASSFSDQLTLSCGFSTQHFSCEIVADLLNNMSEHVSPS